MDNTVVTPNVVVSLIDARGDLVKSAKKTGVVIKNYARAMEQAFDLVDNQGNVTTKWYELKGKLKSGVNAEREAFKNAMLSEGFEQGTIDVYWQRIKKESGYVTLSNRVSGNTSTDEKTKSDLQTIINRIFKAEESGETCVASDYKGALMEVFEGLGGEVDKLG